MRFLCLAALVFALTFALETDDVGAAGITCVYRYSDKIGGAEGTKGVWPSGYRPSNDTCWVALFRGPVEDGDYEQFVAFYRKHHPGLTDLYLQSPGGSVAEAIKIGRLVRKYLISVTAPSYFTPDKKMWLGKVCDGGPDCVCASACGLIWLGAVSRNGRVGLHRPRLTDPAFKALPPDMASSTYRKVLQDLSIYLDEMEAPRPLIDAMVATASSDIHWVEAIAAFDDTLSSPPSWREWIDATCGAFTSDEHKVYSDLVRRQFSGQRATAEEIMLERMLHDKHSKRLDCQRNVALTRRDALPPP